MSEIPKGNPQFVGQADASKLHQEAPVKGEFTISPEQQKVADVMKESGQVLEEKIVDASAKAGERLKKLQGKELVDAGLKQMGHGVWETVKRQVVWGLGAGILGGVVGEAAGERGRSVNNRILDMIASGTSDRAFETSNAAVGSAVGIMMGNIIGTETAGLAYNKKVAPKKNLPPTKWYDWAISNVGMLGTILLTRGREMSRVGAVAQGIFLEVFNPITVGGMRNVATGLWEMRKGGVNAPA